MKQSTWGLVALLACIISPSVEAATNVYFRSIGSAPAYSAGSVTVVNGETLVIGDPTNVNWRTANRGRGDRIRIGIVDYTVLSVDAENEITLTQPYAGPSATGVTYTISRKFVELLEWKRCIDGQNVCPGVTGASLINDDRDEVGVVYKDSPFLLNVGGDRLVLDTPLTDATHTITLTTGAGNRHHGIAGTGVILDASGQNAPGIDIQTDYVTVEWIEVKNGGSMPLINLSNVGANNQIILRNMLIHDDNRSCNGIETNDADVHLHAYNNVIYGAFDGIHVNSLTVPDRALIEIDHNTIFDGDSGLVSSTSSANHNDVIFLKNNLSHSNSFLDFWIPNLNPASRNNYSLDDSGPSHGTGGLGFVSLAAVQFVSTTAGAEDFHIRPGSTLENAGVVVASVPDDLDGRARSLPDVGADEATTSSANPPKIATTKSSDQYVLIEWQNPDFGPRSLAEVRRSSSAFPVVPSDGVLACSVGALNAGLKSACADLQPLTNGTTYYYSVFVYDPGTNFSQATSVTGKPFDTAASVAAWAYRTGATTLAPAGMRSPNAFIVSNDHFLHSIQGTNSATGGEWPVGSSPPWTPYRVPAAVQHRPPIVLVGGRPTALLAAQDGRVYAVDAASGRLVWRSPVLGSLINAAPVALVAAFGATGAAADKVFVGTADISNAVFVLDLQTGAQVGLFDDAGNPANIGAVSGLAVQYPEGPVYFTSTLGSGGSPRSVWSLDVTAPTVPSELWSDNRGHVDAAPTPYKGKLFVGTRTGSLAVYDAGPGSYLYSVAYGNGPVKSPIFPVWPHDTILLTTNNEVHSLQFDATGGCGSAPCLNWGRVLGANSSPILQVPGTDIVIVGLADGSVEELIIDRAIPTTLPVVRNFPLSGSLLGAAGYAWRQRMLYVGDTTGAVYGIPEPIP